MLKRISLIILLVLALAKPSIADNACDDKTAPNRGECTGRDR